MMSAPEPAPKPEGLTMAELDQAINRGEREPVEAVGRIGVTVVYPRFLGYDNSGDAVWELASGRWTWGDHPRDAEGRPCTFEPARYIEKYGVPLP
jgi:hypothetical protein